MRNLAVINFPEKPDSTEQLELDIIEGWLANKPENTRRAYRAALDCLRNAAGTDLLCQAMPYGDPQQAARVMRNFEASMEKYSTRTVNQRYSALRKLLGKLEKAQVVAPCSFHLELRRQPRAALSAADLPSPGQVIELFRSEKDEMKALLWRVLYYCGPRVSEALRLTPADLIEVDGKPCLRLVVKGGDTQYREVVPWLWEMLQQHCEKLGQDDRLFPICQDTARVGALRGWERVGWTGNKRINGACHVFRHCHVSHALEKVSLADAGLSAGHMNSATTLRNYAHYVPRTNGHVLPTD